MKKTLSCILTICLLFACTMPAQAMETRADATAGILSVFAYTKPDGGASGTGISNGTGHAFLAFKNTSSDPVTFGGLSVGRGQEITIGTWNNKPGHVGIWYNLESYYQYALSYYTDRASLSITITKTNVDTINDLIKTNDTWSYINNCSSFAMRLWNSVATTKISAGIPNTPALLRENIMTKPGYQLNRGIGYCSTIGYFENNVFHSFSTPLPFTSMPESACLPIANNIIDMGLLLDEEPCSYEG